MPQVKSAEAFRTISEASKELDLPQHVLRHWEDVFGQIRPMRRAGGRRYYRPIDLDLLRGVQHLLYKERYTTRGVRQIFKDEGVKYVAEIGRLAAAGKKIALRPSVAPSDTSGEEAAPEDPLYPSAAPGAKTMPDDARARLAVLMKRLEKAQISLDEAVIALEAIGFDDDVSS